MLRQISHEAVMRATNESQERKFAPSTIARLMNENPGYVTLANYVARTAKSEIGDAGFKLALECFAIIYRVFELSERYPDQPRLTLSLPEADLLETATAAEIASARNETNEGIKRWQRPFKQ